MGTAIDKYWAKSVEGLLGPTQESVASLWATCRSLLYSDNFLDWCQKHWRLGLYAFGDVHKVQTRYDFHRSLAKKRVIQAPNQVGKTWMAVAEDWFHALGECPWRGQLYDHPTVGLIAIASDANKRPVHKALWDLCPIDAVDWSKTVYDEGKQEWQGDRIVMLNKSVIFLVATSQKRTSLAGETVHWQHCDEPPREHTFGEFVMRGVRHDAPLWLSFTPIADEDLGWLERILYGDVDKGLPPEQDDWQIYRLGLNTADCPWLSAERVESYRSKCPANERAQRLEGEFRGYATERVFSAFGDHLVMTTLPDREGYEFAMGIDHGELAGHQVAVLLAYKAGAPVLVVDEYVSSRRTSTMEDAAGMKVLMARYDLTPQHIGIWRGDINTAGKALPGQTINDVLGAELGVTIKTPVKTPGSIELGNTRVNDAFSHAQLLVHKRCSGLISCLRQWKGANDRFKHFRDALVYPALPVFDRMKIGVLSARYESRRTQAWRPF